MQVEEIPVWVKTSSSNLVFMNRQFSSRLGFLKSDAYSNLYFKVTENEPLILVLYADDLFFTGEGRLIAEC